MGDAGRYGQPRPKRDIGIVSTSLTLVSSARRAILCVFFSLKPMRILLLKTIPGVGKANQVIEAKDGYAMNFLLPKGLGKLVTKQVENERGAKAERAMIHAEELKAFHQEAAAKLRKLGKITLSRKASDKGHLFGGVTDKDIIAAVKGPAQVELRAENIHLTTAIKTVGIHRADITLGTEKVTLEIEVLAE